GSSLVQVSWTQAGQPGGLPNPTPATPPPANNAEPGFEVFAGGADGAAATATGVEYLGGPDPADPTTLTGLAGIEVIDEISILCVPDEANPTAFAQGAVDTDLVREAVIDQCERLKDRFAVLAIGQGQPDVTRIAQPPDTSYAAVYYPWIELIDPAT